MFTPSSKIRLLANVDLDISLKNTLTFSSASSQASFFLNKAVKSVDSCTYIRKENKIRVPFNAETLYNVNYMMFQNTNFGSKWFYAFITSIEYVNENMSELSFEIDAIQTWFFQMEVRDCLVEREHVSDDSIGANLVDEGLNVGEIVTASYDLYIEGRSMSILVGVTQTSTGADVRGDRYGNVYSGLGYYVFEPTDTLALNTLISDYSANGRLEAIKTIFLAPESTIPSGYSSGDLLIANFNPVDTKTLSRPSTLGGYTPRNNKLFTYPFMFLELTADQSKAVYRYEFFTNPSSPQFEIRGVSTGSPQIQAIPKSYKGNVLNYEESSIISGYPQCAWVGDIYSNWLAQKGAVTLAPAIGAVGVAAVTGNVPALGYGAMQLASSIGAFYEASLVPDSANGSMQSDVDLAYSEKTFKFYGKTITSQYAKIIDDYFHAFGYKVNRVKTPNITGRSNWNHVKTIDANIVGDIPSSDLVKIRNAFNNGITFWHNDNIGNYNRSNT